MRPRIPVWIFVLLFWTLLTVIYSTQVALIPRPAGERSMLRAQLTWQGTYYMMWAPFTLLIWRVTARWPLERLGWRRFALYQLGFGAAVAVAQGASVVLLATPIAGPPTATEPLSYMMRTYLRSRVHMQFLIYAAIVATGQAITFYNRYREREVAAARLEAQLAEARLDTLRAQLQPHFLFNSLHSIASLARAGDNAGVVRLISGFSDLLRHLLDTRHTHHTVREELTLVDRYLDIQRVRFGERLSVTLTATPDASFARVPLLVVQPLVENALRHGLAPRVEAGRITVTAAREGDVLVIGVEDDGVGLPAGWSPGSGSGTGLRNLASRLTAEFGARQSLDVLRRDGGGVRVTVRIPYSTA